MKKRVLVSVALVLMAVVGLRAVPGLVRSSVPSIYYVTPNVKTYENAVNCSGTVQAREVREIYLSSSVVAGEVLVELGDTVGEGDLLFRVDPEMTATLSVSASDLVGDLAAGTNLQGLDLSSVLSAYGLSAILGSDAFSGVSSLLEEGTGESSPGNASATLLDGQALEVAAPISGVVTDVSIRANVPASPGKAVVTIADTGSFQVLAAVDEGDVSKIRVGDAARIWGVGFGGSNCTGTVTKIYPTARKALSGTTAETVVDVEITLNNSNRHLRPGYSAKVEISGGNSYEMITVPYEAIRQDENNNEYVYVYDNGVLRKSNVVTGQELTNEVEILDGLEADSVVIYNPDDVAGEGAIVQIRGRADVD